MKVMLVMLLVSLFPMGMVAQYDLKNPSDN